MQLSVALAAVFRPAGNVCHSKQGVMGRHSISKLLPLEGLCFPEVSILVPLLG